MRAHIGGTRKSFIRVERNFLNFNVMYKKFSQLHFNKKTVAKLNEEQLSSVKGGNNASNKSFETDPECNGQSTTNVCSTTSTTGVV